MLMFRFVSGSWHNMYGMCIASVGRCDPLVLICCRNSLYRHPVVVFHLRIIHSRSAQVTHQLDSYGKETILVKTLHDESISIPY